MLHAVQQIKTVGQIGSKTTWIATLMIPMEIRFKIKMRILHVWKMLMMISHAVLQILLVGPNPSRTSHAQLKIKHVWMTFYQMMFHVVLGKVVGTIQTCQELVAMLDLIDIINSVIKKYFFFKFR